MGGQLREDFGFLIVILVLVFACNRDDDAVDWKAVQTCLLCWLLGLFLFAILLRLFFFSRSLLSAWSPPPSGTSARKASQDHLWPSPAQKASTD